METYNISGFIAMREPDNLKEAADTFFNAYMALPVVFCEMTKDMPLKKKSDRVCRFCGKKSGDVKFKKKAHRISELLGNKYFLSDFECDTCNEYFGKYENDLAIYFAPLLAMQGISGKEGKRTFKSSGGKVRLEPFDFEGVELMHVSRQDTSDNSIVADRETGKNAIELTKGAYSPLFVYKAFLKMAISCLTEEESRMYQPAINYLMSDTLNEKPLGFTNIILHQLPLSYGNRHPVAFMYKRKDLSAPIPTHIFALRFANCIIQMHIPLNQADLDSFYKLNNVIEYPVCPPVFPIPSPKFLDPTFYNIDLHNNKKIKAESHSIHFSNDPDLLKKVGIVVDPETGEHKQVESFGEIKGIVITPAKMQLNFEAVKRLSNVLKAKEERNKIQK